MTIDWETRVPFHTYVRLNGMFLCASKQDSLAFDFCSLPAELQYRILAFCSPDTLFQLMHVCSALRTEAAKLF